MGIPAESLMDLLETEGFRVVDVPEDNPLREVVFGRRVRLLDHDWPLTLRVYTGIFPEPETEEEKRRYHLATASPIFRFAEVDNIRLMLVWRDPDGFKVRVSILPRIAPDTQDVEGELRMQLRTWMDYAPIACPSCNAPMCKRSQGYQEDWVWACPRCATKQPIKKDVAPQ